MKRITFTAILLLVTFSSGFGEISESIKKFIEGKPAGLSYQIDNENLLCGKELNLFYGNRYYDPAWSIRNSLSNNGFDLLNYIRQVGQQGLQPNDYHLYLIESYFKKVLTSTTTDTTDLMKLDVLLTDAFLLLGSHLYYGKVDPEKEGANWKMKRKDPELRLDLKLEEALLENEVDNELNMLAPKYRSYWRMKDELAFFLKLDEQSWPVILSDKPVKPGDSSQIVPKIRERLIKLRYGLSDTVSTIIDNELEEQLKMFQNDWGLNADGVLGKTTLEYLNCMPLKLMGQLKVNMERFRWLPSQMTEKHIIVNIANFKLDLIVGADTLISMRAVVGKETKRTPVFNESMTYIVFSPAWTVPNTILKEEVIPQLLKGPGYLVKKNMKLFRNDGTELAYSDVDWSKISESNFPYMVRQGPGPGNALGRVKFMFPNDYNVYIHDTPSRSFFARDARAVSHGCIRVEDPFDLAVLLLSDEPEWSPDNIRTAMQQTKEQTVLLKVPVDVMVVYLTAWTDGKDRIQFRNDVYNNDEKVLVALNQKPEVARATSLL
ncbi:MAG TPA: L,D-transpeptidase family protein [Bacteroidales bacterium]|nr:L,D-transpeptidase family protein [Bacteroidales bacterium]